MNRRNCELFATVGQAAHAYSELLEREGRDRSPSGDFWKDVANWLLAPTGASADGTPAVFNSSSSTARRLSRGPRTAEEEAFSALRDEVRAVVAEMREREMALWREEAHVGPGAAALMLDGFAARLAQAVGDELRPAVYHTPQAAQDAVLQNPPISPPPDNAAWDSAGHPTNTGAASAVGAGLSSKEGRGHA